MKANEKTRADAYKAAVEPAESKRIAAEASTSRAPEEAAVDAVKTAAGLAESKRIAQEATLVQTLTDLKREREETAEEEPRPRQLLYQEDSSGGCLHSRKGKHTEVTRRGWRGQPDRMWICQR